MVPLISPLVSAVDVLSATSGELLRALGSTLLSEGPRPPAKQTREVVSAALKNSSGSIPQPKQVRLAIVKSSSFARIRFDPFKNPLCICDRISNCRDVCWRIPRGGRQPSGRKDRSAHGDDRGFSRFVHKETISSSLFVC
jgi:hypothetical protein